MMSGYQLKWPLLVRPKPFEFESLESYLTRVGLTNGFKGLEWVSLLDLQTKINPSYIQNSGDIHKLSLVLQMSESSSS
jgi:hypothetical protein